MVRTDSFLIATAFVAWRAAPAPSLLTTSAGHPPRRSRTWLFEDPRGSITNGTPAAYISDDGQPRHRHRHGRVLRFPCGIRPWRTPGFIVEPAKPTPAKTNSLANARARTSQPAEQPLKNALYLLDACGPHEKETADLHSMNERQLDHLVRLVDDLLDVSRITQGKIELNGSVWKPAAGGRRAASRTPVAHRTRPRPAAHLAGTEDPTCKAIVYGSRKIFINLLNNAVKYTPRVGSDLDQCRSETADEVVFRVRDTGHRPVTGRIAAHFSTCSNKPATRKTCQGRPRIGLRIVRSFGGNARGQS